MRVHVWCFHLSSADLCVQIPQQTPLKTTSRCSHRSWTACWTATIIDWDPDWEVSVWIYPPDGNKTEKHKCRNLTDSTSTLSNSALILLLSIYLACDNHKYKIMKSDHKLLRKKSIFSFSFTVLPTVIWYIILCIFNVFLRCCVRVSAIFRRRLYCTFSINRMIFSLTYSTVLLM